MTANSRLSYVNRVDISGAAITSAPTSTDNPASNVADPRVGKRYRASGVTSAIVYVDCLTNVTAQVLAVLGNADLWSSVRWQLSTVASGAGEVLDTDSFSPTLTSDAVAGYGLHRYYCGTLTFRYLTFTARLAASGTIDIGRLHAGPYTELENPVALGEADQWEDSSRVDRAEKSGAEFIDAGVRRRLLDFQTPVLSSTDRDVMRELSRQIGVRTQVFFDPQPDDSGWPRDAIYGRLDQVPALTHSAPTLYEAAWRIRSSFAVDAVNLSMV